MSAPTAKRLRVGVVGVGTMGRIVAAQLVSAGYEVIASDPAASAQASARDAGASLAGGLGEVGGADIVFLSLPGPAQVEAVVLGEGGLLERASQGQIIVDLSTVDPSTTRRVAGEAAKKGIEYIDAPILGRPASFGRWVLPAGGNPEVLERCRPLLETFAARVVHVGPSGAGHTLKLLNQMMFAAINAMTAEMLAVSVKAGIPARLLMDTITSSGAATVSPLLVEVGNKIASGDFEPVFSVDLLCKDTGLAIQMARSVGAPPIITSTVQILNELARARGLGALDTAAVVKVYEALLGGPVQAE